jgi:hypothetical protein
MQVDTRTFSEAVLQNLAMYIHGQRNLLDCAGHEVIHEQMRESGFRTVKELISTQ